MEHEHEIHMPRYNRGLAKWLRKLEWIMKLKAGDIVTRRSIIAESEGFGNMELWPVEFIHKSYETGLVPHRYHSDLKALEDQIVYVPTRTHMMLTGRSELGCLNCNCDRASNLAWYYASDERKEEIKLQYEAVLGPGTFLGRGALGSYSLLISYPQVMILGTGAMGYIQPHVLKNVKGGRNA